MAHRRVLVYLGVALLLVYGVVLPTTFINRVTAHDLDFDLVNNNGELRYYNATGSRSKFGNLIHTAEDQWQPYVGVQIREVSNASSADVTLTAFCGPNTDLMGATYSNGVIKLNRCLLNHKGGRVEGKNGKPSKITRPATNPNRKQRSFVHEFGHALGLAHTPDLLHRQSVMSEILKLVGPNNAPFFVQNYSDTIYKPTSHDINDVQALWP